MITKSKLTAHLVTPAYKFGARLVRSCPERFLPQLLDGSTKISKRALKGRKSLLERHQKRVSDWCQRRDERSNTTEEDVFEMMVRSYAIYWFDSFRLLDVSSQAVDARFSWKGLEHFYGALDNGKGAIMVLPHLGSWEIAGKFISYNFVSPAVVVERLKPPSLLKWFVNLRSSLGMQVIPSGPEAVAKLTNALSQNQMVCLVADRNMGKSGIEVDFFGEKTRLPAGPALLALRTGAALLPAAVYSDGLGCSSAIIESPILIGPKEVSKENMYLVTQQIAQRFESAIAKAPEQWHMFQPNWPTDFV